MAYLVSNELTTAMIRNRPAVAANTEQTMSTTQTTAWVSPRFRLGYGMLPIALGALVAIAVTTVMLALIGANRTTVPTRSTVPTRTTVASPAITSQPAGVATPQVHYLGPRQTRAALYAPAAGSDRAAHYTCLGAPQRCLR
jgi:hypothetical protein